MIASVAKICAEKFEFTKAIYAPTLEEWEALIANNPFPDFKEGKHVHAAVLAGDPDPAVYVEEGGRVGSWTTAAASVA